MGKKTQEKADETKKTTNQNEAEMTPEERAAAEAKFLERVRGLIGVARKKKIFWNTRRSAITLRICS